MARRSPGRGQPLPGAWTRAAPACAALLLLAAAAACAVEGEPLVAVDRRGPLLLASDPPQDAVDVPRRCWPRLTFDEYLEPGALERGRVLELRSGAHRVPATLRYDLVRRSLQLIPGETLAPLLLYRLSVVRPELVRDLTGNELAPLPELTFVTGREPGLAPSLGPERSSLQQAVQRLLDDRCVACHGEPRDAGLPDLRRLTRSVGRLARTRADRPILVPGHPAESYLLHKVLPAYPDRGGEPMPLAGPPLDEAELDLLAWAVERSVL